MDYFGIFISFKCFGFLYFFILKKKRTGKYIFWQIANLLSWKFLETSLILPDIDNIKHTLYHLKIFWRLRNEEKKILNSVKK